MKTNHPSRLRTYTLTQVFDLDLPDSPSLGFKYEGVRTVVQDSHVTVEELLSVPGFANTRWEYIRTTNEWIPVFSAVDDEAVVACVDVEPYFGIEPGNFWVTPKGFPRTQYDMPFDRGHEYQLTDMASKSGNLKLRYLNADGQAEVFDFFELGYSKPGEMFATYRYVALIKDGDDLVAMFEKV